MIDTRLPPVALTLEQFVARNIMSQQHYDALNAAIENRHTILVTGPGASGKTTLLKSIINQMVLHHPLDRFCILDDHDEVQCAAVNHLWFSTNADVSMSDILKLALPAQPDHIVASEIRGDEALAVLNAWNTGHKGGAGTLHANSALMGLIRLKSLVTRNESAPMEIEPLIGEAVQLVVHIARIPGSWRVEEVVEISGYANGKYLTKTI